MGIFYYVSVMSMTHRMINPRNRENSSGRIIMHREIQKQKTGNDSSSKVRFVFIYPIYPFHNISTTGDYPQDNNRINWPVHN